MSLTHHKTNTDAIYREKYRRLPKLDIKNTRKDRTLDLDEQNNRRPSTFIALAELQHDLKDPAKYFKKNDNKKKSIQLPDIHENDKTFMGNYNKLNHNIKKYLEDYNEIQSGGKKNTFNKKPSIKRRSTKKPSIKRRSTKKPSIKRRTTKKPSIKRRTTASSI